MLKAMRAALCASLFFALLAAPSRADNRINDFFGMQQQSQWQLLKSRYQRLGDGAFRASLLGTAGTYWNLCVTPTSGLDVQVAPCSTNSIGTVDQYIADDASAFGGGPISTAQQLPADPTQILVQGMTTSALAAIGPLSVPSSNSQISLIECQVSTVDTSTVGATFNDGTHITSQTVPRERDDTIACQAKAGTAAPSPSVPSTDTGWVAVAYVTIPSGTSTVTSGMITAEPTAIGGGLVTKDNSGNVTLIGKLFLNSIAPAIFPIPTSANTFVLFGDSLTYGGYGPTSCKAAQGQPSIVVAASLTGKCWADLLGAHYGASVIDLGVGGSTLTNVGPTGGGQGILRYNASYTCPTQATSPTSGLPNNCNGGQVLPALDSVVSSSTFLVIGYFGHNDNYYNFPTANYTAYLSALQTVVNDAIAHGQPANQIIFLGAFGGGNGSNINDTMAQDLITSRANAVEASLIGARYVDVLTPMSSNILNDNSQSVHYDSIHPNDNTNCVGTGCVGGSATIAAAIEAAPDIPAAFYAASMGLVSELYSAQRAPQFDQNGNLSLPSGSNFVIGNTTYGNASFSYSGNWIVGTDGNNTLLRAYPTANAIYMQGSGPTNWGHWSPNGLTMDSGSAGNFTTGSTVLGATSLTLNGTLNISPNSAQWIQFHGNDVLGGDTANTVIRSETSGGYTYLETSAGGLIGHFTAGGFVCDASACTIQVGSATAINNSSILINNGYAAPVFKANGTSVASTQHCVGQGDTVTASGSSTTVNLTSPASFSNANYILSIEDLTTLAAVMPSSQTASSFAFPSTSGHNYAYSGCGY